MKTAGIIATVAIALALSTACEPPPPRPTFTVTTTVDGVDAAPGDGACEKTPGAGDCTLRAALAEAQASGPRADIVVPAGRYVVNDPDPQDGDQDLDITGDIRVNPGESLRVELDAPYGRAIDVHAGGVLTMSGLRLYSPALRVAGSAVLDRADVISYDDQIPALDIPAGGIVVLGNSAVRGVAFNAEGVIANHGTLVAAYVTVDGFFSTAVHTAPGASTTLTATLLRATGGRAGGPFWPLPDQVLCTGTPPTSGGYNHATNPSCGLTQPTDIQDGDSTGSWIDRIPAGDLGCGDPYDVDMGSLDDALAPDDPRPLDGDGDGVAACDIGADEEPAT